MGLLFFTADARYRTFRGAPHTAGTLFRIYDECCKGLADTGGAFLLLYMNIIFIPEVFDR